MSDDSQLPENEAENAESGTADATDQDIDVGSDETELEEPAGEGGSTEASESSDVGPADLEAELAEVKDSLLRKTADFDNYRKRMMREKEEFAAYANRELLLDIVTIIDDFERAIRSADESHDFTAFHDGIVMIEKQFTSMLERKWKLARFDSAGEEFDPQKHEAMMTEERADHDTSLVLEDFQKGYMLHEKVLRPAKVKVSMPGSETAPAQEQ